MKITIRKRDLPRKINEYRTKTPTEHKNVLFARKNSKLENSLRSVELCTVDRAPISIKLKAKEDCK